MGTQEHISMIISTCCSDSQHCKTVRFTHLCLTTTTAYTSFATSVLKLPAPFNVAKPEISDIVRTNWLLIIVNTYE